MKEKWPIFLSYRHDSCFEKEVRSPVHFHSGFVAAAFYDSFVFSSLKLSEAKDEPKTESPEMEILSKAIADERDASSSYAEMAEAVSDPKGKEMLQKLSAIEKGHLALLEEEYEFIRRSKSMFPLHRFTLST